MAARGQITETRSQITEDRSQKKHNLVLFCLISVFCLLTIISREGFCMSQLKGGDKAPDFKAISSEGKEVSLKDYKGNKRVVLYFYPKDDTPGCTVEACSFRDNIKKIEKIDAVVLGISPDNTQSHNKFIDKFKLPFLLLSDEDKAICNAYGVWVKKSMYGKETMGVARTTFVIGKDGKIEKIFEKVKPDGHAEEVLEFLNSNRN